MPTPTTAAEVEMALVAREVVIHQWMQHFVPKFYRQFERLERMIFPAVRRQPHTDDMVQMLVDLGIEPQPFDFRNLTFEWRTL